jgi:uncharacterized protein (TIGR00288 family)
MTTRSAIALLIDADNVTADVIDAAVQRLLADHGALHLRRAYGNAETMLKLQPLLKRLSIRPMTNLAAGKNSTDIALAVDAIDLALRERPAVIAIASSDSDFAPLVLRLRECGCRVIGIGQQGKTGDATMALYDAYEVLTARGGAAEPPVASVAKVAKKAARKATAAATKKAAAPAKTTPSAKAPAKKAAATKAAAKAAAKAAPNSGRAPAARKAVAPRAATAAESAPARSAPPAPSTPRVAAADARPGPDLEALLAALPALAAGQTVPLSVAAATLKEAGLLGRSVSTTRLFARYPGRFELTPGGQPNAVRLASR